MSPNSSDRLGVLRSRVLNQLSPKMSPNSSDIRINTPTTSDSSSPGGLLGQDKCPLNALTALIPLNWCFHTCMARSFWSRRHRTLHDYRHLICHQILYSKSSSHWSKIRSKRMKHFSRDCGPSFNISMSTISTVRSSFSLCMAQRLTCFYRYILLWCVLLMYGNRGRNFDREGCHRVRSSESPPPSPP